MSTIIGTVSTSATSTVLGTLSPGGIMIAFFFNGSNQYATHASWDTLGDSSVYPPIFSFSTNNPDGYVVDSTIPITEFGRVDDGGGGYNYHAGSLANLQYIDTSPLNGRNAAQGPVTIPELALYNAEITIDISYISGAQVILDGSEEILSVNASDILVHGANVDSVTIDGTPDAGTAVSGHMRFVVRVSSGTLTTISGASPVGNMTIENYAY